MKRGDIRDLASGNEASYTMLNKEVHLGESDSANGVQLHVFDGGSEKPSLLVLYDHAGTARYLWVDNTGDLRIHTAVPTNEDSDGTIVGTQD